MSVDPNRQWFVYFKETEMGPFAEPEMIKKIKAGEFDGTAFVYTDGMSDWELIKDTQLQDLLGSVAQVNHETQDFSGDKIVKEQISSVVSEPIKAPFQTSSVESPSSQKKSIIGFKPLVAVLFVVLVAAGYLFNRDLIDGYITGANSERIIDLSDTIDTQSTNPAADQDTSVNWSELDAFVRIQDPQGPSFRIAEKTLAGMRPIIVGALSPMLKMERLTLAVFPDGERSLYGIAPVWIWDVGVHDGYFSAGPHLNSGGDLLPGRYRVLIAAKGKFLGDVGFELGVFPIGDELAAKKAESQKLLVETSAQERSSLKTRIQSADSIMKRATAMEPLALDRQGKRRAWLEQRGTVITELGQLRDMQYKVMTGPMFYYSEQSELMALVRSLEAYLEALEFYSFGGPEHVKLKSNTTVQALKGAASEAWQKLQVTIKDIDARESFEPLRLDAEVIKARVLEESK
jgi:hypothetical protein